MDKQQQALVLSGGGARAAYQVGALRHIARVMPDYRPNILTGVSAGAINAVHLAAYRGSWVDSVEALRDLWLSLETAKVYHTDIRHVLKRVLSWGVRVLSGGKLGRSDLRGMVDSAPLEQFLRSALPLAGDRVMGVGSNVEEKLLEALAIISTNYNTGRSVAWVESASNSEWRHGQISAAATEMTLQHVLASAALPMFFPAVSLQSAWHGDGGIRLTAPLSPAMHLGATQILAVSPRAKPLLSAQGGENEPYPSPAKIAGVMLNAVFLDLLDYDALQMNRINHLVSRLPEGEQSEFRRVDVMVLRPREDLGKLAAEHEFKLPKSFRFFERGFANRENDRTADALSMVIFEPDYLELLMRLGEEDAAERSDEIQEFLRGEARDIPVW
jgi:NTE family protein